MGGTACGLGPRGTWHGLAPMISPDFGHRARSPSLDSTLDEQLAHQIQEILSPFDVDVVAATLEDVHAGAWEVPPDQRPIVFGDVVRASAGNDLGPLLIPLLIFERRPRDLFEVVADRLQVGSPGKTALIQALEVGHQKPTGGLVGNRFT